MLGTDGLDAVDDAGVDLHGYGLLAMADAEVDRAKALACLEKHGVLFDGVVGCVGRAQEHEHGVVNDAAQVKAVVGSQRVCRIGWLKGKEVERMLDAVHQVADRRAADGVQCLHQKAQEDRVASPGQRRLVVGLLQDKVLL